MKKHRLLLFLLIFAASVQAQTSAKQYVLIEHFTNSKCSVCASKNPAFYNLINQYTDDIHHISIHPPFPYNTCAFYLANTAENIARTSYYGVFGTPSIALNGTLQPITTPLLTTATLQSYLGNTSPLWLEVAESGPNSARQVAVTAHSLSTIPAGSYKLYVAVVEKEVAAPPPPNNGEPLHHDVFRKMLPDINGTAYTPAAAGQSVEFNFTFAIGANWNPEEVYVIAWVQNTTTKEVLNSGTRFDPPAVSGTDEAAPKTIQIQPNPVDDLATARIGDDTAQQVEIYAANGQRVSVTFENQEIGVLNIPTAAFSAGVYFVKITGEKGAYVAKMVKN